MITSSLESGFQSHLVITPIAHATISLGLSVLLSLFSWSTTQETHYTKHIQTHKHTNTHAYAHILSYRSPFPVKWQSPMSREVRAELKVKAPLSEEWGRNRQSSPESSCLAVKESMSSLRYRGWAPSGSTWPSLLTQWDFLRPYSQPRRFKPREPH